VIFVSRYGGCVAVVPHLQAFANQKRLGVILQDAKLTPWSHDLLKNWDEVSPDEKKLFIRQADVFGAYFAYTDHGQQVSRPPRAT
jgi:arylsulfatase A-like enzyme